MRSFSMIRSVAVAALLVASVACKGTPAAASATRTGTDSALASMTSDDSTRHHLAGKWTDGQRNTLELQTGENLDATVWTRVILNRANGSQELGSWINDGQELTLKFGNGNTRTDYTIVSLTPHQLVLKDAQGATTTYTK